MSPEKEQVTRMILSVDLKCPCCYKKVRKLLCKFPQIRDQVFDEEKNKVMITVVCCDPEKMRDKLCCKGGKVIQSIEISKPPKPQSDPPKKPQPVKMPEPVKKIPDPQPQPEPVKMPDPKPQPEPVKIPVPVKMPDPKPQPEPVKIPVPVKMPEPMPMEPFCPPVSVCCQECYEGRGGGPCHYGNRPPCYGPGPGYDYGNRPPCYGYGPGPGPGYGYGNRPPCYVSRCDYFSEENPQGCSIM